MKLEKLKTIQLQGVLDYCKGKKDIFLYGTGDVAKALIYDIGKYTNIEIKAIVVSDGMKDLDELSGIPVFEVSRVNIGNKDGVIVATRNDNWREIDENIRKRGCGNSIFFQQVNNSISCMQRVADSSFFINGTSNSGEYFEELKDLQVIGEKYGTDKSRAGFLSKYDFVLRKYRNEDIVFVELGVFKGNSIKMWRDYFKKATIYGVDIVEESLATVDSDSGISILIKDLGKEESLSEIAELAPTVVIDDASHIWSHQISALIVLFQSLKSGGVYILEDIHTSFRVTKGWGFDDLGMSAYDFCTAIQEVVTSGEHLNRDNHSYCIATMAEEIEAIAIQVDMISFVGKSCILIKK